MNYTESAPLNMQKAIDMAKEEPELNLFLVEVGLFSEDDTNTPIDSLYVLTATDNTEDAKYEAIELCEENIGTHSGEFFSAINNVEQVLESHFD